jgi:predicted transcriptional regulator
MSEDHRHPSNLKFSANLGRLEQRVLSELWSRGSATVREVVEESAMSLAYTTVMTTLDRLYKKKLLERVMEGRAYRYFPRHSREDMGRAAAAASIRQLIGSAETSSLPLSYLVETLSEYDAQLLDQLQSMVERKRRELKRKEQG